MRELNNVEGCQSEMKEAVFAEGTEVGDGKGAHGELSMARTPEIVKARIGDRSGV